MSIQPDVAQSEFRERFYRSVAETLALLHAWPERAFGDVMAEVAATLAGTMRLPLVWIARREAGQDQVTMLALAGEARAYGEHLRLSANAADPEGDGPIGRMLRDGRARVTEVDAPEFAPWREAALAFGFGATIAAVSALRDGGQLVLSVYSRAVGPGVDGELLDWAQRLVDELARFRDHQQLLERSRRVSRYRDAQRAIQRALLEQPDPPSVYRTLAELLVEIAGAVAVDVLRQSEDGASLERVALAGPIAGLVRRLPLPQLTGAGSHPVVPTKAFLQNRAVVHYHPRHADWGEGTIHPLLHADVGAVGCWPLSAALGLDASGRHAPTGVIVVMTAEVDAFDTELRRLLDEIADAAGLSLRQHARQHALVQERERQTWLALHDDLTGLPNRRSLDQLLEKAIARVDRDQGLMAVGLLDLDDFKPINDRHGHAVGDRLLIEMANRFRRSLRAEDSVARLGGDEFVLVFEGLESGHDIDGLIEHVGEVVRLPMVIDGATVAVGVSLGLALHDGRWRTTGEQLLRRADQAMYRIKACKHQRTRWWALVGTDGIVDGGDEPEEAAAPHGVQAARVLRASRDSWQPSLAMVADEFWAALRGHAGVADLLASWPAEGQAAIRARQLKFLRLLFLPGLRHEAHRARAERHGVIHAASGLEEVWLLEVIELLRDILLRVLGSSGGGGRRVLSIALQRLDLERRWQLESMRALQRRRVALLARINALAWAADKYLRLIQGVADALAAHEEILACAVGRPDADGQLVYEAVAGEAFARFLHAMAAGKVDPVTLQAGAPETLNPTARIWHTQAIERCGHFATDPTMARWRASVPAIGVLSCVALPLCSAPGQLVAALSLYLPCAGGFRSEDQDAFLRQLKSVLDLALARLVVPHPGAGPLPFFVRERWRARIAGDALEMHYQPQVRLADGATIGVEALARLRDEDGALLAPAQFLPALGESDLFDLFRTGLRQAVRCRAALAAAGHELGMAVNMPAVALEDAGCMAEVRAQVESGRLPPAMLQLEVLGAPAGSMPFNATAHAAAEVLAALGVRLVEGELAGGYGSLARLHQWPFERVKISRSIIARAAIDPLGTLRFVRQLIRIGRDLGFEVVAEGLETPALIEATTLLGAHGGQGFAFARPLSAVALAGWLAERRAWAPAGTPRSSLGALAGELLWEEQFLALPADPAFWRAHAHDACEPGHYLAGDERHAGLLRAHHAMHVAAAAGPQDRHYRKARGAFLAGLVAAVLQDDDAAVPAVSA